MESVNERKERNVPSVNDKPATSPVATDRDHTAVSILPAEIPTWTTVNSYSRYSSLREVEVIEERSITRAPKRRRTGAVTSDRSSSASITQPRSSRSNTQLASPLRRRDQRSISTSSHSPATPKKRRRTYRGEATGSDSDASYDPSCEPATPNSNASVERRTLTPRSAKATAQARMAYIASLTPVAYTATLVASFNGFHDCTADEVDQIVDRMVQVGYEI